jgi:hypothetical protein
MNTACCPPGRGAAVARIKFNKYSGEAPEFWFLLESDVESLDDNQVISPVNSPPQVTSRLLFWSLDTKVLTEYLSVH